MFKAGETLPPSNTAAWDNRIGPRFRSVGSGNEVMINRDYNGARVWVENPQLAMKVTGWDGGLTTPAPSSGQDPRVVIGLRMSFVTATRKTVNYA